MKKFFQRSKEVFLNFMHNVAIGFLRVSVQMFHMVVAAL